MPFILPHLPPAPQGRGRSGNVIVLILPVWVQIQGWEKSNSTSFLASQDMQKMGGIRRTHLHFKVGDASVWAANDKKVLHSAFLNSQQIHDVAKHGAPAAAPPRMVPGYCLVLQLGTGGLKGQPTVHAEIMPHCFESPVLVHPQYLLSSIPNAQYDSSHAAYPGNSLMSSYRNGGQSKHALFIFDL